MLMTYSAYSALPVFTRYTPPLFLAHCSLTVPSAVPLCVSSNLDLNLTTNNLWLPSHNHLNLIVNNTQIHTAEHSSVCVCMCEWVCAALLRSHSPSPHLNFFSYRLETVKTCVYLFLETIFLRFGPRFYFVTNLWITFARNAKCVWVARKQKQRLSIGRARSMMRSIFDAWRRWESVREQSRRERK